MAYILFVQLERSQIKVLTLTSSQTLDFNLVLALSIKKNKKQSQHSRDSLYMLYAFAAKEENTSLINLILILFVHFSSEFQKQTQRRISQQVCQIAVFGVDSHIYIYNGHIPPHPTFTLSGLEKQHINSLLQPTNQSYANILPILSDVPQRTIAVNIENSIFRIGFSLLGRQQLRRTTHT